MEKFLQLNHILFCYLCGIVPFLINYNLKICFVALRLTFFTVEVISVFCRNLRAVIFVYIISWFFL